MCTAIKKLLNKLNIHLINTLIPIIPVSIFLILSDSEVPAKSGKIKILKMKDEFSKTDWSDLLELFLTKILLICLIIVTLFLVHFGTILSHSCYHVSEKWSTGRT